VSIDKSRKYAHCTNCPDQNVCADSGSYTGSGSVRNRSRTEFTSCPGKIMWTAPTGEKTGPPKGLISEQSESDPESGWGIVIRALPTDFQWTFRRSPGPGPATGTPRQGPPSPFCTQFRVLRATTVDGTPLTDQGITADCDAVGNLRSAGFRVPRRRHRSSRPAFVSRHTKRQKTGKRPKSGSSAGESQHRLPDWTGCAVLNRT